MDIRESTIQTLLDQITGAWDWLKQNLNINDDNLQIIIQYVLFAMTIKS